MNDKDKARKVVDGEDNNTIQSSSWNSLELGGASFLVDGSSLVGTSSFHSFSAGPPDFSFLSDHDHEQTRQATAISSGELRKEEQSFSAGLSDFSFLSARDHEQTLQTTAISSQLPAIEDSSGELRKEEQSANEKESSETAALRKEIDRVSGQLRREHLNQRPKRTRSTEIHNMCEKRRRERISEKIKTLQELIPNCDKRDRSSVLDDAIEYLKALKLQEQMLSVARRPMFQAPYMSAAGIPSMQAPQFSPFGPMRPATPGMGMAGFYLPTGLPMMPFSPAYIYPSLSVATAGGLNLNPAKFSTANLQMSYIPPQPFSAAAAATLPSQPICTASNSAPFNYSSNQGESSPQTALRSSTDSQQVTSTSQDQTSEPWTQATSISWL